jgi:hypothetical protein
VPATNVGHTLKHRRDGAFGIQDARLPIEHRDIALARKVAGISFPQLRTGQHVDVEVVLPGGLLRTGDCLRRFAADVERAGHGQETRTTHRLELSPQLEGLAQQRDVERTLEVGGADDARISVRRPVRMGRRIAVETDDLGAALGEPPGGGGAHDAAANDGDLHLSPA